MSIYLSLFNNRTNGEAEAPIFWSSDAKDQLIEKSPTQWDQTLCRALATSLVDETGMRWLYGMMIQWT